MLNPRHTVIVNGLALLLQCNCSNDVQFEMFNVDNRLLLQLNKVNAVLLVTSKVVS